MIEIYSKVLPNTLLHLAYDISELTKPRVDLCAPKELLQVASLHIPSGKRFRAHKHIPVDKYHHTTQESWVVISGKVKAIYYDLDDEQIAEVVLGAGGVSITFQGGHNYEAIDESLVYEFKTGEYLGAEKDKVHIENE